ncbi:MAG: regulatory iron-sulfur-containing complex subunit RicT [Bacteroidota bacterium]
MNFYMEEKEQVDPETNNFLTRGCCHGPKLYNKNEGIFNHGCSKMDVFDWLKDIPKPEHYTAFDCVEVRFKNNRKDYFRLPSDNDLHVGDIVAVEASPGHDIGIISLKGELVRLQMQKHNLDRQREDIKKVYRKARLTDIEKWLVAVAHEDEAIFKARKIAVRLNLNMKINDVEYQGDDTKAVFFYTADNRVDFRELIKVLADEFKVRIEMRQIGARQEAGRLGGIGSCGRELCCSSWLNNFHSVSTNSARAQQLSPNPQKLAGQCAKLKCCLNFEYDAYLDALKHFPEPVILKTKKGEAVHQKTDVFADLLYYGYKGNENEMFAIPVTHVKAIIEQNKKGQMPENLENFTKVTEKKSDFENVVGLDDLTRFDKPKNPRA